MKLFQFNFLELKALFFRENFLLFISISTYLNISHILSFFFYSIFSILSFLNLDLVEQAIDRVISGMSRNALCLINSPGCIAGIGVEIYNIILCYII